MPFYEHFSKQDPFFASLAETTLDKSRDNLNGNGHIISPAIWALLEGGNEAPAELMIPDWHKNHTAEYSRPNVHYGLISRNYSTGVVFRARKGPYRNIPEDGLPLRGMQTWAWKDENPVLLHARQDDPSWVQAGGIKSNETDVSQVDGQYEVIMQTGASVQSCDLATFTCRRRTLWSLFACTPVSTVVAYDGSGNSVTAHWKAPSAVGDGPVHNASAKRFDYPGRTGKLYYLNGDGSVSETAAGITAKEGPLVCAFSNDSFAFQSLIDGILTLADASGFYQIDLTNILIDRNLNRTAHFRIERKE